MNAQRLAVLVPTLMADASSWADVAAAIPDRLLLPVELPGHGLRRAEDFSFAGAVTDTLHALDQVAHGYPVHLVGSGLGSAVALSAALAEPTRVLSVLVAGFVPAQGTSGNERLRATEAAVTKLGMDAFVEGYLDDVLSPGAGKVRKQLVATMSGVRPKVMLEALGAALRWRLAAWPPAAPPACVIHASRDIRVTEAMAREFARVLHGDIIRLRGPGHLAYVEEPRPFAEAMDRFHARIESAAIEGGTFNQVEPDPRGSGRDRLGEDA